MAVREYSSRLGAIRPEQFQAALDRFGLGRFLDAQPIPFGLFSQNVFLTSTAGEFVLRGVPHFSWQFPAERFFANLLHERTAVPVPWPYRLDPASDLFGWSYVVMPRMPGLQLADPAVRDSLGEQDRHGIARAMAENLARMHDLAWPFAGRYDLSADTIQPFPDGYVAWVIGEVRRHLRLSLSHSDRTTSADVEWVEQIIASVRDLTLDPSPACLVMNDYKMANLTVSPDPLTAHGWRVSGVFDLMECHFGDALLDLCRQAGQYLGEGSDDLARAYVTAYLSLRPPRPGATTLFRLYMLRDRLQLWEYFRRPSHGWQETRTLREWAERYVEFGLSGED